MTRGEHLGTVTFAGLLDTLGFTEGGRVRVVTVRER